MGTEKIINTQVLTSEDSKTIWELILKSNLHQLNVIRRTIDKELEKRGKQNEE